MMSTLDTHHFYTFYPDPSETKHPVRRSSLKRSFVEINILQPSQSLNHPLPSLPYSPDVQQFVKKFKCLYSGVTDDENLKFCSILVKLQHFYATHRNDVDKMSTLLEFASNQMPNFNLKDPLKSQSVIETNLKNYSMNSNTIRSLEKLAPPPLINLFKVPPFYILSLLSPKEIQ